VITGNNTAGKSTLLHLLDGSIQSSFVHSVNLHSVAIPDLECASAGHVLATMHKLTSTLDAEEEKVPHDVQLTLAELIIGDRAANPKAFARLQELVDEVTFCGDMPQLHDKIESPKAVSGAQKRKIAILRFLFELKPTTQLLVVDEPDMMMTTTNAKCVVEGLTTYAKAHGFLMVMAVNNSALIKHLQSTNSYHIYNIK
jgi:ABC-type lipoprotein export system ATPase subunit